MRKMIQECNKHDNRGPQKSFLWISELFNTQGYNYSLLEKTVRQKSIRPLPLQSLFSHCVILQSRDFNPALLHPLWSLQDQLICLKALIFYNLFLFPSVWSAVVQYSPSYYLAGKNSLGQPDLSTAKLLLLQHKEYPDPRK